MLEDTLVIWGGEFGRDADRRAPTPGANAGKINGRDHKTTRFFNVDGRGAFAAGTSTAHRRKPASPRAKTPSLS